MSAHPRRPPLAERLATRRVVIDGGLATELEADGHDLADRLWTARLLRDDPLAIEAVHRRYFAAGADVAITASYQVTFEGFAAAGIGTDETARLLRLSVELARRARDEVDPAGLVAASVGPYAAVLADRSEYTGDYGRLSDGRLAAVHRPRIAALLEADPDLLAIETIPSLDEAAALAALVGELDGVEVWMTFCCRDGGRLSDGSPIEEAVHAATAGGRLAAVGVNCVAPRHVDELLDRMRSATTLPLLVYPNAGRRWAPATRSWHGAGDAFAPGTIEGWRARGAAGIGGCCGVGADTVAAIAGRAA